MIEGCDQPHHSLLHEGLDEGVGTNLVDLVSDDEPMTSTAAASKIPESIQCMVCKSMEHELKNCPDLFCHHCKKLGHFPKDCKGKSKQICQYCKMPGHGIAICPIVVCRRCGRQGHTDLTCTFDLQNWFWLLVGHKSWPNNDQIMPTSPHPWRG